MSRVASGTGVSPGIAIGPAVSLGAPIKDLPAPAGDTDPAAERDHAHQALDDVAADLERRRDRAGDQAAEVLDALAMMARDPALLAAVERETGAGKPAPHAVDAAVAGFRSALEATGGYLAERAADLADLRNRAVARLLDLPMPGIPDRAEPFVLVADDLAPADTVDLRPGRVLGLVTRLGGPTSHTAIIAKSMGLPCVVACADLGEVPDGTTLIVDGSTGRVTVEPSAAELKDATDRRDARAALIAESTGPGRTADGHPVQLLLNLGATTTQSDTGVDAEGVGLLRTEFLFLDRNSEPTVDEQAAAYRGIFTAFSGRKVVVRTLDVGADKPLPFVQPGPGDNPALGLRGWRLRQHNPGLIERQLDAIVAAMAGTGCDVWVMAPMISTVAEATEFVQTAHAAGVATAGVMVEVPSLALRAEQLVEAVDFASIGTNDLSQYTFAADRLVGELGELHDPWQPAALELVARTAQAGQRAKIPVGVCGEAASDPALAPVLVGLGCTSLSMAPGAVPEVRAALAAVTLEHCQELARLALDADDNRDARSRVATAGGNGGQGG